jgi:hypothetical protein
VRLKGLIKWTHDEQGRITLGEVVTGIMSAEVGFGATFEGTVGKAQRATTEAQVDVIPKKS